MPRSGRVRLGELRRAFRLIHDCRDVGHNPAAWLAVLVEGMAPLVDAQIVLVGEVALGPPGSVPRGIVLADRGWLSPADRDFWMQRRVADQSLGTSPTFRRYAALEGGLITRSVIEQLTTRDEWYASDEYNEFHRPYGMDDMLASNIRSGDPPTLFGVHLVRPRASGPYGSRERRLIRIFHRELARHIGSALVREPGEPLVRLPPRLRQTLECLLEGDSEKQVAHRMGLSRHTVHEYVTELYRRLGVGTRAELLALCLRHRPRPPLG
jgi:DNA-binding CsgD family transcriptional regulator